MREGFIATGSTERWRLRVTCAPAHRPRDAVLAAEEQFELWLAERNRLLQFMLGTRDPVLLQALRNELSSVERLIRSYEEELGKRR